MNDVSEIELRLQRIAGHARRGWPADAARELGVTVRTIHRARGGYLPATFLSNLEEVERRRREAGRSSAADLMLSNELGKARGADKDPAYIEGMIDGWTLALREIKTRVSDQNKPIIQRFSDQRDREMPGIREERRQERATRESSIGERMLERVGETVQARAREKGLPELLARSYTDDESLDLLATVAFQKILDAIWRHGVDEGRRVAEVEERRIVQELCRIHRI